MIHSSQESSGPNQSRRQLLSVATFLLGGLIAAIVTVPVLGTLLSPIVRPMRRNKTGFRAMGALGELSIATPKRVEIVESSVDAWARQERRVIGAAWLIKRSETQVDAFTTVCPHLGCGINFNGHDGFACPCHTSAFELDGRVKGGPAPRGMDPLQVRIEKETVYVRYARFKQGQSQREEV